MTGCSLMVPELTDLGLMKSGTELDVAGGQQPVAGMSRADQKISFKLIVVGTCDKFLFVIRLYVSLKSAFLVLLR